MKPRTYSLKDWQAPSQTNQKRGRTQINKIRDEKGMLIIGTSEMQRIIMEYFEKLFNRLENLEEMNKFLDTYNLPNRTKRT
jgi:hypothetical protein